MNRALAAAASIAALTTSAPFAVQAKAPPSAPAAHAAERVAPVNYTFRQLPNGLKVYTIRDMSSPNVAVHVWYQVGSKDDPVGRSGFAHLFEHMMFKATRDMPSEYFDRITEDVGGLNNASTNDDYTEYHEVVPANYLKPVLWAEAERMGALVVDDAAFKSERDVVKEELRQRVLAQPYGKLFALDFPEVSFQRSPYGRPGIGSIENLDASTINDVRAFHATYYRPDNAVLVVSGNFDPKELDGLIDKFFAPIPKPSDPIPRVTAVETPRTSPTSITDYEPNTPLPAVLMSYPFPPASDPDMPALTVMDAILSKGDSSRLHESLVYRQRLAQQAFSALELRQQPGAYAVGAILSEGKSPQDAQAAVLAELKRLRDEPVTPVELARAKSQLVTDELQQRETVSGKAEEMANAVVIYGDPTEVNRQIARIEAVTAADVQRVARKYLGDNSRAQVTYLSDAGRPKDFKPPAPAESIVAQPLPHPTDLKVVTAAPEAERIKPPAAGEPVATPQPATAERKLSNGLRVIVATKTGVPLVTASLVAGQGGAGDPADLPGDAAMTAELMTKGTTTRSALDIARQTESLGGSIDGGATFDGSHLAVTVKRDNLDAAMTIFADVARNPAFASEELERARQQALNELEVGMKDPATLAGWAAGRAAYGSAPYGEPMSGTPSSLPKMKPEDLKAFHDAWWRPSNATLVLSGDITADEGFALAQKAFGDWKDPASPPPQPAAPAGAGTKPRIIVVDLPDAGQAAVVVVRPSMARKDDRYYAATLANSVLGGGYSARLNEEIRVKRGLSYGASSSLQFRKAPGPLVATTQTKNESAPEVVDLIVAQMKGLGEKAPTASELAARKAAVVGSFGRRTETTEDMAGLVGGFSLYGVELSEIGRYADRIKAVSPEEIAKVAHEAFSPAEASIVVVGDAKLFLPALKAKHPDVEVIPADKLDLDSAALVKK
jgi:zinc protease